MASQKDLIFKVFTGIHRTVYDLSKGKLAGRTAGMPVLKLTTVGRKSGDRRTTMLTTPLPESDLLESDDLILIASFGGDDRHPAWYLNLVANPDVEIEMDGSKRLMRARVADGAERTRLWDAVTSVHKNYAGYQTKTERELPVVVLSPH